jgi:hypothetical protein
MLHIESSTYFHQAMEELNAQRIEEGFTPIKYSGLGQDDKQKVWKRVEELEGQS